MESLPIEKQKKLVWACRLARDTFRDYAAIHREKKTIAGARKAALNDVLADLMDAALKEIPLAVEPWEREVEKCFEQLRQEDKAKSDQIADVVRSRAAHGNGML